MQTHPDAGKRGRFMKLNGLKINFLGDSITEGCGTSDAGATFVEILRKECGLAAARNYGIGGTRLARQRVPSLEPIIDRDFCSRIADMDPEADVVVVFGGTNDYGHGDAPFGVREDRTADTFYGACHELFTELKKKYPAARIVVITPLHRCNETDPKGDGRKAVSCPPLKAYAGVIREVAELYGLPVLDLFAKRVLDPNDPMVLKELVPDGLHPNDAGHVVLAREIKAFLEEQ